MYVEVFLKQWHELGFSKKNRTQTGDVLAWPIKTPERQKGLHPSKDHTSLETE